MQHTELLHRFFDEGLEESLEDILFERMAVDPELRGEFLQHLKLHSMIQEDVASITTPSQVSQQLFETLGLTPPETVSTSTGSSGLRRKIGALAAGLRTQIASQRRYLYTALISAAVTAFLIFGLSDWGTETPPADAGSGTRDLPSVTTRNEGAQPSPAKSATHASDLSAAEAARSSREENRASDLSSLAPVAPSRVTSRSAASDAGPPAAALAARHDAASATPRTSAMPETSAIREAETREAELRSAELPLTAALVPAPRRADAGTAGDDETALTARILGLGDIEPVMKDDADGEGRWHFFRPGPQTNLLSNLVFELRKLYGQSFPSVDLPHNSHRVFEDMAISAVYKVTDHHAFGFEYGREGFGRVYQQYEPMVSVGVDPSVQELFDPPEPMMMHEIRETRMLDIVGAVWKLSLPEYGMFGMVYPYMRSFVGATRLGPLGKVRIGLEMFPSNFSMLNVGIEGGLLRYTEEDMAYYTSKLNFTFGVAIGF